MSLFRDHVLEEVVKLDCVKELKVTVGSALKYGSLVGAAAVISGILGGPRGLAIGGAIGSCIAGYMADFKSVPYILLYETTPQQRKELSEILFRLLNKKNINTLAKFLIAKDNDKMLMQGLVQAIIMFLSAEMNYKCST